MLDLEPGIPAKVLRTAAELGVHPDCIMAGRLDYTRACESCISLISQAMDRHYGEITEPTELMAAIFSDLQED